MSVDETMAVVVGLFIQKQGGEVAADEVAYVMECSVTTARKRLKEAWNDPSHPIVWRERDRTLRGKDQWRPSYRHLARLLADTIKEEL